MKKSIILLIMCFMICGCSSEVIIEIEKDRVIETYKVVSNTENEYNQIKNSYVFPITLYIDQKLEEPWSNQKESGVPYYETDFNDLTRSINIKGDFPLEEHNRSFVINECFRYYNIIKEDEITIFSTSKGTICNLSNFKLSIKTPYLVVNSNSQSVDKSTNTFVWNINESNFDNINIHLEIDFSKKYNEVDDNYSDDKIINDLDEENYDSNNSAIWIFILIGFISVIVIVIVLIRKNKKQSSI